MGIRARKVAQSKDPLGDCGDVAMVKPINQDWDPHCNAQDQSNAQDQKAKSSKRPESKTNPQDSDPDEVPTVGSILSNQRKILEKSLSEISQALRISEDYLRAIEENRRNDLPERVYALGFFRTYSQFLGFQGTEMVTRFCEEVLETPQQKNYRLPISYSPKTAPSRRILRMCLFFVILLALGWVTFEKWSMPLLSEQSFSTLWDGKMPLSKEVPLPEGGITLSERGSPLPEGGALLPEVPSGQKLQKISSVDILENNGVGVSQGRLPQEGTGNSFEEESETPQIEEDVEEYARQLKKARNKKHIPGGESSLSPSSSPSSSSPVALGVSFGQPFRLVFTEKSWIEIRRVADNSVILQKTFFPKGSQEIPQEKGLVLRVGNAGGVKLSQGGRESNLLGKSGQVLSHISLEPESLKTYFIS